MKEYFNFHKIKTHILKYILKHDVSHRERESEYGFRPSFLYCALIL